MDLRMFLVLLPMLLTACDNRQEHDRPRGQRPEDTEVKLEEMVLIWSRDITKGEKVGPSDIRATQHLPVLNEKAVSATRRMEHIGKTLQRDVMKDQYVREGDIGKE